MEHDTMGEMEVPADALWGASTQRAVLNFPISGEGVDPAIIHAYGWIKGAAAQANEELGKLSKERAELIRKAAEEVSSGQLDVHFVVDVFQTGSGTSTNMNANEVISNRCCQLAGEPLGSRHPVHPNDHVNAGQSSNDTFPTAIHLAVTHLIRRDLIPALAKCHSHLDAKAKAFHDVLKIGRTHLMDATPVRLGAEFSAYARQLELAGERAQKAIAALHELPLGGTAVGTGLNCPPGFSERVIELLGKKAGIPYVRAKNAFEVQGARDGLVEASGLLRTIAVSLFKVANDLRWLSSGPRCGISEISLPETQPGSSIMPGKVNPVICESVMQVCAQVIGNDEAVAWGGANGNLELNTMMPMMAQNVLRSVRFLSKVCEVFAERCLEGIQANEERCLEQVEWSMAMVTKLVPEIGYEKAAEIAKEAVARKMTVRAVCIEHAVLETEKLEAALDPLGMVGA